MWVNAVNVAGVNVMRVKQASAALCVHAGGFLDPDDVPGLAHFLEHSTR